jgi:DNA (cytosine-5)-methyltransferase 1
LIPQGEVDERSICDVKASDIKGFTQCHFFAGIAGWSLALRLAGWSADRPVWTGSCPCQPFSYAGKNEGTKDSRDLWPIWARLIAQLRPPDIFGEQVPSAISWGWYDRLADDLEALSYACGACVLSADAFGAHDKRERLFWGARADTNRMRPQGKWTPTEKPWSRKQFEGLVQATLRTAVPSGSSGGLSDGLPARVVRLRSYGNAIKPQIAAEFIRAFQESESLT